jgi:O-acetyl-ADP-ribose deacetylase (regulator of RNase III)
MRLHIVDINPAVAEALAIAFAPYPEVEVLCDDLLKVAKHCIVSPANSFGYMDGGIDAAYSRFFGSALQITVQTAIQRRPEGMLPVGAALAVRTGHERIPYLIIAPTMEIPEEVPASHAQRALRAVLRLIDQQPELDDDIYCPGLATGVGGVYATDAAENMRSAYAHWLQGSPARTNS